MFKKILIANRGEIALRIQRTCREMGIKSVIVYSEADREAKYVKLADEAVCIGPAASAHSYLNMPAIISTAEVTDAEALEVVVGLPRSLSGEEGAAAEHARRYARALARAVAPVPVRLVDERLTTVVAHRNLHDSGRAGRRHREVVDQAAAVLILQTALDHERTGGTPPGELVTTRKPRRKGPQG